MPSLRRLVLVSAVAVLCSSSALAGMVPTIKGTAAPTAAEAAFVTAIRADLCRRFSTPAAAKAAGYFRYTNADETGAISYADLHWVSRDARHPSQLWYGKDGSLLGADFSVLKTGNVRPDLWGVRGGRWYAIDEHIHYVTKDPASGELGYDKYVDPVSKYVAAGGDPKHPDAAVLVKMHRVASASDVAKIFDFPSIWDLIVWVKPNPSGPFAEKNPLVKP